MQFVIVIFLTTRNFHYTLSKNQFKNNENLLQVESVVGHRVKSGKTEYKIRWKGYKASADSWEPEDNLSCQDLISKYLEDHSGETKVCFQDCQH